MISLKTLIANVVTQVRSEYSGAETPYFYYGYALDIITELVTKSRSQAYMEKRFPMVVLLLPQTERIENDAQESTALDVQIAIATYSKVEFTPSERFTYSYETANTGLYVIYDLLMKYLGTSVYFGNRGRRPDHDREIKPYWGREVNQNPDSLKLIEPIDAILISNMNLQIINRI